MSNLGTLGYSFYSYDNRHENYLANVHIKYPSFYICRGRTFLLFYAHKPWQHVLNHDYIQTSKHTDYQFHRPLSVKTYDIYFGLNSEKCYMDLVLLVKSIMLTCVYSDMCCVVMCFKRQVLCGDVLSKLG